AVFLKRLFLHLSMELRPNRWPQTSGPARTRERMRFFALSQECLVSALTSSSAVIMPALFGTEAELRPSHSLELLLIPWATFWRQTAVSRFPLATRYETGSIISESLCFDRFGPMRSFEIPLHRRGSR